MNVHPLFPDGCKRPDTIVVCGSMTHFSNMCRVQHELKEDAVPATLPDAEGKDVTLLDERQYRNFIAHASLTHLKRIRSRYTFAILVTNFEKHGIEDYIGPSTFAEIALAALHGKRIFILNEFPVVYRDLLSGWKAVPLQGRLDALVDLYRASCRTEIEDRQLEIPV